MNYPDAYWVLRRVAYGVSAYIDRTGAHTTDPKRARPHAVRPDARGPFRPVLRVKAVPVMSPKERAE